MGPNGPRFPFPVNFFLPRAGRHPRLRRPCGFRLIADDEVAAATVTPSPPAARSEHLPHEPEQAPALAGVQGGTPWRPGHELAEQPLPDGLALRSEHDVLAAPVPLRRFPPRQPVLLQGVRDRGDEGGVAAHPLAEFLHRQRSIELDQGDGVAAVEAELDRDALAELVEELEELGERIADQLVELLVGQRLGVRDRLGVEHRSLEYCPRTLVHIRSPPSVSARRLPEYLNHRVTQLYSRLLVQASQ